MGCNCGKRTLETVQKYSNDEDTDVKNESIVFKFIQHVAQFAFGIFAALIFIIMSIPALLYIVICLLLNKRPSVKIKKDGSHLLIISSN